MAFVYAWIVPLWADQLLPQFLMEQFKFRQFFTYMAFVYAWIVPLWADQLLPQFLKEQFDVLPLQCRHIEHMHEGVWFRKNNF